MKAYISTFTFGIKLVSRDYMLLLMALAPFLAGAFFKIGVPIIDTFIAMGFSMDRVLINYYQLFDLLLVFITPYILCTVASFVMLEERDDGIGGYLTVTPVGSWGYIVARLIMPALLSCFISIMVMLIFKLTEISLFHIIIFVLLSSLAAISISIIVVALAGNKVEGLTLTKLTGNFTMLGMFIPFFVEGNIQYLFAPFPAFWLAKAYLSVTLISFVIFFLAGVMSSTIWIIYFYRLFSKKIF